MGADRNEILTRPTEFEFMELDEWDAFNAHLRKLSASSDLDVIGLEPGELVLEDGRRLCMLNLAQLCHINGPECWGDLIESHLENLAAHVGGIPEPFSKLDLRVRLLPDDRADRDALRLLGARPFVEGVVQTLTVRLTKSVRPVSASEIEQLGWDLEDVWASAWAQTRTLERPEEASVIDANGAEIMHMFAEHFFCASFLPYLDDIIEGISDDGALVSIPVRHSVLLHPIFDSTVLSAVQAMIPITRQLNLTGPGAISAHLYWWRQGSLTWVPTYFAPDGVEFYPPPELAAVIESHCDFN